MPYRLLFCSDAVDGSGAAADLPPCAGVPDFRRDLVASDPDWTRMQVLPRPGDPAADRYLLLEFDQPPPEDQLQDLRYVAARNRLTMVVQA